MGGHTPKFELMVDGSPVDPLLVESVIVISVHKRLDLADMLTVRVGNDDLAWSQSDLLSEGKPISVKLGYEETELKTVFTGEITGRDCVFPSRGPAIVKVVAYDKKHRLKKGNQAKVYMEMTDSDIVSQIASEVGLSADVDPTDVTHEWVFQQNKTHLEFLADRARQVGYSLKIDPEGTKLQFKKPNPADAVTTLTWGQNLLSFRPRMSTANQINKVVVSGWDPVKKERVETTVQTSDIAYGLDGSKKGADLAPAATFPMPTTPVTSVGAATPVGQSLINQAASKFCEGTGSCQGDPNVDTGSILAIDGVGKRASGQYLVEEVLHHLEASVGYTLRFGVSRASEQKEPDTSDPPPEKINEREDAEGERENWVEIRVRSETGESLEGVSYTVTLPNGEQKKGTLDEEQVIRIDGIRDPGEAKIELEPPEELTALE